MQYIIGIDLGTTNCTLSYSRVLDSKDGKPSIEVQPIEQLIDDSSCEQRSSLPSFVYFPLEEELKAKQYQMPGLSQDFVVGLAARQRGAALPHRLISSAKSWLCHDGIDRREKILPYGSDEPVMSPLQSCAELLNYLALSWDKAFPQAPFSKQKVLVTVPASFDPSARQLVQEAAQLADYPEIILLEEPQAAFYAWLYTHIEDWRDRLQPDDQVLVVDVGGGTTDFTLIKVVDNEGNLELERVAVGSHLLLGGDNMDLGLAHLAKTKLEEQGHVIDDWQLQSLVHVCRQAKETLLTEDGKEEVDVTIHGRGKKLVASTLTTKLSSKEVHDFLVDGFIPMVEPDERSKVERRSGIQQVGLPFALDPRISCQLAKFLSMTGDSDDDTMENFVMPTAVLFNGGTMKGEKLRERVVDLLNSWAKTQGQDPVKELPDPDYDQAVSRGAVYYGVAREGGAIRIKGGISRSYYIGVEGSMPAVPGIPAPMNAVCVAPFGMEEGTEVSLDGQQFALVVGEMAKFRFFSRGAKALSDGSEPVAGQAVRQWKGELSELHPIETLLEREDADGKTVRVTLQTKVTELGVLELWCVAPDGRKWKLEFDIRQKAIPLGV